MNAYPAWLREDDLQRYFTAVREAGGEARAVGGAVRDFLMGRAGSDVDLACSLKPEATMQLAEQLGWKAVPTGILHGTVTLVLPHRTVEVTTLRRDVATDGRHAEVEYSEHFEEDAARRDFTMNAMYMDASGTLYDYFNGRDDAAAGRVRFIGDAVQRIAEDGLRILRFFRFLATHGNPPADSAALHACGVKLPMIKQLSGERIAHEMKKLLGAPDPSYALAQMGVLAMGEVLCGHAFALGSLPRLLQLEAQHQQAPNPWVRLLAILSPTQRAAAAARVSERWRLSRAETQLLEFLTAPPMLQDDAAVKEALRHYKREWILAAMLLQALDEPSLPFGKLLPIARSYDPPVFPVKAQDLMERGMREGPELGMLLRTLEKRWVESGYRMKKEELLG